MATLILTAVGTVVGGPIGGAIGAILGQAVDQRIFAPKARHGPRLGDLAVQSSSYGAEIPRLFGTMRVAWATDLIEQRSASGGGKGRPKTIDYSYSASFAVALSARPIRGIGRIWADGKLLRGAAGDFKSATGYRLYLGDEDQPADPLIAAAEGIGAAPAFRGLAYAVFEDFQLEDYGNRIPSLTFEVEADAGEVEIGAIAAALGGGAVTAGLSPALAGYAASGDSVRGAIEALADIVPLSLADDGAVLRLTAPGGSPAALSAADAHGRRELTRRGAASVADEVSLTYYEIGRDYQAGLQRAIRGDGAPGGHADRRALPAALTAERAKALAAYRLAATWAGRTGVRLSLCWRGCGVRPGDLVSLPGDPGLWRVARWTLGPMTVDLELVGMAKGGLPEPSAASPGQPVSEADLPHGPTLVHLLDLPLGDGLGNKPLLFVAAAGSEPGWRRAALSASYDDGGSWQEAGTTAAPAAIGRALAALPAAGSALFDTGSALEVELAHAAMWLEGRSDDALAGGANLALAGNELIQFGAAEPLGENRFRLSRLLRGRRGTEWAAGGHEADERFILLDAQSLAVLEAPAASPGGAASLLATGIGDLPEPASAAVAIEGASLQPPSPVHLRAEEAPGGDLLISWVRRSRQGWAWLSGTDTPLGEERELYRLEIEGVGFLRAAAPETPSYLYTVAQRLADGAGPIRITVAQIGTFAPSRPALLDLD
jgi:hypothetical protein